LLSVTELADKIGKSRQAVSQFENGTITPTPDILSKIASTTGFPLQYFFKEERIQNVSSSEIPIFRGSTVKTKGLKRSYEIASMWSDEIRNYLKNHLILIFH
jgi:transcriptional regulator with XRE-family HTH domain